MVSSIAFCGSAARFLTRSRSGCPAVLAVVALTMSFASVASGASYTWDGNGSTTPNPAGGTGTWSTSIANWWDGTQNLVWPSSGTDNDAVFANTAGAVTVAAGGVTVNDLTFAVAGYNVSGGPLTLNATSGTAPTVATVSGGGNEQATLGSNLSGSLGLRKTGDGVLFLTGSNSGLSGPLVISGVTNTGGVRFSNTAAFGGFTSVDISGNGHLSLVSTTIGSSVSILAAGGGGTAPGGTIRGHAGTSVIDGPIQLLDGNVRINAVFNPSVASTLTINGAITAPAASGRGLNFRLGQDNGVVITNTANYWEGITYVSEGVVYAFPGALPSASNLSIATSGAAWFETNGTFSRSIGTSAGQVQFSTGNAGLSARGGDLTVNLGGAGATMTWGATGFSPSVLGLNSPTSTGRLTFSNPINLNGATRTVRVDKNVADLAGALTGAGAGLTKTGTGTLQLSALNSYSGTTTISAGILRVGNGSTAGTLGTGPVVNNAALIFSRSDDYGVAVSNAISGTGSVTLAGGTLALSASNSFTGATAINAGTLLVNDPNALAGTGTISFGGGVLRYSVNNAADYAGKIAGSGSAIAIDTNGRTVAFGSALASTNIGGLTKSGSGSLSLNAANLYSGVTTISAGTLALGLNGSFASSPTITIGDAGSSGAVLDISAKSGTFAFTASQTVRGIGALKMDADDTARFAGVLAPGNSPGVFTVDGGTALLSGTTHIEIFGSSRGTTYDAIDLINAAALNYSDGVLLLDFGSTLGALQSYQLFGDGTQTLGGSLATVTIAGSNYAGLSFTRSDGVWTSTGTSPANQTLTFTEATGTLVIVPEPQTVMLAVFGTALAGWHVWRRKRHGMTRDGR